ncbi:MAG TPA: hypothetical protein VK902_22615 [Rubrobacter sp.]|jgi:hypothetical protein|nr:hypothetical protein [Rubrobacter sp.]
MTESKVHGNTRKAADMALAKRLISRDSHGAVHEGRITVAEARRLGRARGPEAATSRGDREEGRKTQREGRECLCSCGGETRGGRFLPGHDQRLFGELKRNLQKDPLLRNLRFNEEQRKYARQRGLV